MKRRTFGIMSAAAAALGSGARSARAATQAELLKTTLTPFGAERAGNSDGSIPAWTGGMSEMPDGVQVGQGLMPDFFGDDKKIVSINVQNMAQYKDKLTAGTIWMMQKYPDFRIDVYPTHRTAAANQSIYDNMFQNVQTAKAVEGGARLGFTNAFGGVPFPIPDQSDPLTAGAQVMWNHICRWQGYHFIRSRASYVMDHGTLTLAIGDRFWEDYPFYKKGGSYSDYNGYIVRDLVKYFAPPNMEGQEVIDIQPTNPLDTPHIVWVYLAGEGRVRKAPDNAYDTPAIYTADIANYDEYYVFMGALDRYDWKLLGKKEVYIPYNNNKLFLATPEQAHLPHFMNPDLVRWELHRVWEVEATLHPGQRNVLARRRYYVDEDNWHAVIGETYDGNDNMYKIPMMFLENRPDIPAVIYGNSVDYNVQTGKYVTILGPWNKAPFNQPIDFSELPENTFNPQTLGATAAF